MLDGALAIVAEELIELVFLHLGDLELLADVLRRGEQTPALDQRGVARLSVQALHHLKDHRVAALLQHAGEALELAELAGLNPQQKDVIVLVPRLIIGGDRGLADEKGLQPLELPGVVNQRGRRIFHIHVL